jgi:cytochrome o ubiquinol oxidase subunit 2
MNPAGDIAKQQAHLVIVATLLMLIIVVPVMLLIVLFAWRYRASANAHYEPEWHHSTQLELLIWSAPLLIIIALGSVTWVTTHLLDPFRPLDRVKEGQPIAAGTKPLEIEVVALDWKWLFIYPEQGVASVNEVALPVDRPVHFSITASSVMNSFYIPAVAGRSMPCPA